MSRPADPVRLPGSGGALIPLPRARNGAVLALEVPPGAAVLEVRGIATDPGARIPGPLAAEGEGLAASTQLPVPGGVWMRLDLAAGDEPRRIRLTLPPESGLRHLLARVPPAAVAGAGLSFSGLDGPPAPAPAPAPAGTGSGSGSGYFAPLLRSGEAGPALAALQRLPANEIRALIPDLLAALADDPGERPSDLLPFLMLLARD